MRAWAPPEYPDAPFRELGPAPELRLHDTRTGEVRPTRPGDLARLYVCGITPYDATHMGHSATYTTFDLVIRAWRAAGHEIRYVQNVTDVDDPLLERARDTGEDWRALAERETDLFREDMAALSVIPPDVFAGAVESIPIIIELIEALHSRGAVYDVDGDLYFPVAADPHFAEVSGWTRDQMLEVFAERGGDPDRPGKRDPLDGLLWLRQRDGDPGWESPFGVGRPGWHVECAAIARTYLGSDFDVQGGGTDLIFPHHEMSAGHAQAAHPESAFAQAYVHQGMVGFEGHKMSKSLGNLVLVSRLRADGVDPAAIRLVLATSTTATTGSGRRGCSTTQPSGWLSGAKRYAARITTSRRRSMPRERSGPRWPTTWTRHARSRSWTRGPRGRGPRRTPPAREPAA